MMTGMGMGFGGLWMFIIWLGIIGASVWLLSMLFPQRQSDSPKAEPPAEEEPALAILQRRYGRGELTREEFDAIRRDLEQT